MRACASDPHMLGPAVRSPGEVCPAGTLGCIPGHIAVVVRLSKGHLRIADKASRRKVHRDLRNVRAEWLVFIGAVEALSGLQRAEHAWNLIFRIERLEQVLAGPGRHARKDSRATQDDCDAESQCRSLGP